MTYTDFSRTAREESYRVLLAEPTPFHVHKCDDQSEREWVVWFSSIDDDQDRFTGMNRNQITRLYDLDTAIHHVHTLTANVFDHWYALIVNVRTKEFIPPELFERG